MASSFAASRLRAFAILENFLNVFILWKFFKTHQRQPHGCISLALRSYSPCTRYCAAIHVIVGAHVLHTPCTCSFSPVLANAGASAAPLLCRVLRWRHTRLPHSVPPILVFTHVPPAQKRTLSAIGSTDSRIDMGDCPADLEKSIMPSSVTSPCWDVPNPVFSVPSAS